MSRRLVMSVDLSDQESEGVIVDTDEAGAIVLELESGQRLKLDEEELRSALDLRAA